jgi:hypothetical protein
MMVRISCQKESIQWFLTVDLRLQAYLVIKSILVKE